MLIIINCNNLSFPDLFLSRSLCRITRTPVAPPLPLHENWIVKYLERLHILSIVMVKSSMFCGTLYYFLCLCASWCSLDVENNTGQGVCTEGSLDSPSNGPAHSTCDALYFQEMAATGLPNCLFSLITWLRNLQSWKICVFEEWVTDSLLHVLSAFSYACSEGQHFSFTVFMHSLHKRLFKTFFHVVSIL